MNKAACSFCEIVNGYDANVREVYRDDNVVAFFPTEPAVLGHTMIVPRRHVPDVWELHTDEAADLAVAVVRLSGAVRGAVRPQGLNVIQSNGVVASQTVPHLHIHLVPRTAGDAMGPIWPESTDYTEEEKDSTLMQLKAAVAALPTVEPEISPEDRRKHLDYIQAVVTRQSAASASTKGWLLPVVTAVLGFALAQHVWPLAVLGIVLIAVFAYVDASYLRSEQEFRTLYKAVSRSERMVPQFTLDPTDAHEPPPHDAPPATKWKAWCAKYIPSRAVWASWSIAPFYAAMLILGVGVAVAAAFSGDRVSPLPEPKPTHSVAPVAPSRPSTQMPPPLPTTNTPTPR